MRARWLFIVAVFIICMFGPVSPAGVSGVNAQSASGYVGPLDDGCYFWWDAASGGYTERHCQRADDAFDVFVPDGYGRWDYWETGLWLDDGSFVAFSNAGYYGPLSGCSYYWDGYRVIEVACPKENDWYGIAEYDSSQGTWTYAGDAIWYEDGSQRVVFPDGTEAYRFADGRIVYSTTNGVQFLFETSGAIYAENAQGDYAYWDATGQVVQQGNNQTNQTNQSNQSTAPGETAPEFPAAPPATQSTTMQLYEYASEHPNDPNALALFQMYTNAQSSLAETWTGPDCNWSRNGCR